MATTKVVFSITAPQLDTLRALAKGSTKDQFPNARRDPRWSLVSKGLAENSDYRTFTLTDFGRALLAGLSDVKT